MAHQNEHDSEYRGIMQLLMATGFAVICVHLYVSCYSSVKLLGFQYALIDKFLRSFNQSFGVFNTHWAAKLAAILIGLCTVIVSKARKNPDRTWGDVSLNSLIGVILYFGNWFLLSWSSLGGTVSDTAYMLTTVIGYFVLVRSGTMALEIIGVRLDDDPFNIENESFQQEEILRENEYSVNLPLRYYYKGKKNKGWVNVVNPFRAALVIGIPGSGKTYAIINQYIKQHLQKGFAMYIYDFKFPDLTNIAYNYALKFAGQYETPVKFYFINFDDPLNSHRCNPLTPSLMDDVVDAIEAATTILLNMNKTWIQKQGDFFVESPINFVAACIWVLKKYDDRIHDDPAELARVRYELGYHPEQPLEFCTFPHVIEFANREYDEIFPILLAEPEVQNLTRLFASALKYKAFEQLEGQIASARLPLARLSSKSLYWVMTGGDFTLDINEEDSPKILCVGNNPDRQKSYGPALGLYNSRLIKLVNRKGKLKSSLIIDELPTIYFPGLDNLIATARSNKVSTCLGLQDLSQFKREYGDKEATALFNTIGNVFSGAVVGETAKALSGRFGKNVQQRQSFNITEKEVTTNLSTQMESLIPESKITTLSTGDFVGTVADNYDDKIQLKAFNGELVVPEEMQAEIKGFAPLPKLNTHSKDEAQKTLDENLVRIKNEVAYIIHDELKRIRGDAKLRRLLKGLTTEDEYYLGDDTFVTK